ncbi:MAG: potassium channel protein [Deltaproteobacteria bacterium]|nr:potassium channel protein [Deltaproteobacteria bacterium]
MLFGSHQQSRIESKEILPGIIAISSILCIGTLGFSAIEGWNIFDSLYMTVITISTVGFQEIHPLSDAGRAFAIILIILGVGAVTFVFSTIAKIFIENQIYWIIERKSMKSKIKSLSGHTIICGYGRLSRIAAGALDSSNITLVVIDHNEEAVKKAEADGLLVIKSDATHEEALLEAGIKSASRLISLLPSDAQNLYVVLTARELNKELYVISRAEDESGEKRLLQAGANKITAPYRVGGQKIADGILRPFVTDFIDLATSNTSVDLEIEEIRIPDNSPINGMSLEQSEIRQRANIIVAAIISADGKMHFNPSGSTAIESGSTIIGLGVKSNFHVLQEMIAPPPES